MEDDPSGLQDILLHGWSQMSGSEAGMLVSMSRLTYRSAAQGPFGMEREGRQSVTFSSKIG